MTHEKGINKQDLKAWGLLKNKNDFAFFYRITKMLSSKKIAEFGETFLKDLQLLTDIVKNGKKEDAKIYVDKIS